MSTRKRIVEKYIDGFRRSDHARILSLLASDVVWELHGYKFPCQLLGRDLEPARTRSRGIAAVTTATPDGWQVQLAGHVHRGQAKSLYFAGV